MNIKINIKKIIDRLIMTMIVIIVAIGLWIIATGIVDYFMQYPSLSDGSEGRDANEASSVMDDIPSELVSSIERFIVTAYCPCELCCGEYADGITASGHIIKKGDKFIAAPNNFPFGTMVEIPGYGNVSVLDRGGAIKKGRFDIYFDDADGISGHQRALNWGVKEFDFVIYRKI